MLRKNLFQQLFSSYLLVTCIALGAIGWYTLNSLRDFYYAQTQVNLESQARLVLEQVQYRFSPDIEPRLQKLCETLGVTASMRITVMERGGQVVCDSHEDPTRMDNHRDRPEIQSALSGKTGAALRPSKTLHADMMYVAVPLRQNGSVEGVVRTALSMAVIAETLEGLRWKIVIAGLVIAGVAAVISLLISRRISHPLSVMRESAERFADGDLESRIRVHGTEDITTLAKALNKMAMQLDERIRAISATHSEQEAILSSMVEGVLAFDAEGRIVSINQAAARFVGTTTLKAQGRVMEEVVRHASLERFVQRALTSDSVLEDDIVLPGAGENRLLQVVGTVLKDFNQLGNGAVVVLNDVTRLRRLETIRRDFVANVSHELKTPITSIKGFVETLLDGALTNPDDLKRFLTIVARQADRLNSIIEDLLSLSRIEIDAENQGIAVESSRLKPVLQSAINDCQDRADKKNIRIDLVCENDVTALINDALIEQAVINLVDNAIKYSEPETAIRVQVASANNYVTLGVADQGHGVPKDHLPRLFERFYRVDKARSRKMGGTGLGLAIVKHIAQAHRGEVSVQSLVGKGSVFKILLPIHSKESRKS